MPSPIESMLAQRANFARQGMLVAFDQFHTTWMRALMEEPPLPSAREVYALHKAMVTAWDDYRGEVSYALAQLGLAEPVVDAVDGGE